MTNYGKLFADELTEWLIEPGFIQYQFQISIYYKYALDGTKIVVLYYIEDCVYYYTYESLGNIFVETLGNIFHVKFLGYAHWFISIRIFQKKDHSISVDQNIYATSIVAKYLDTATFMKSTNFYKTILTYDMIFTKAYASTRYEKVENLTRPLNISYIACIGSFIYLLSTKVELSFAVHKFAKF